MLREAVESFEPRSPERPNGDGGTTTEPTPECRAEHEAMKANAAAGVYAGRGEDLARDFASVGAPEELVDLAREGYFEEHQAAAAAAHADAQSSPEFMPPPSDTPSTLGRGASPAGSENWPPKPNTGADSAGA